MKKTKSELTRRRIIEAGISLFVQKGFSDTSLAEVSKKAHLTQPALFHHFKDKYELFGACSVDIVKRFQESMAENHSPMDRASKRLEQSLCHNLKWIAEKPKEPSLLIFLYYGATQDERLRVIYAELLKQVRARYSELIYAGIREGDLKPAVNPEIAAEMIHDFLLGSLINLVATQNNKKTREALWVKWKKLYYLIFNKKFSAS